MDNRFPGVNGVRIGIMTRSPNPIPQHLGPVFRTEHAVQAGVHGRRLSQPDLARLLHGVYARAGAEPARAGRDAHPNELWRIRQERRARALAPVLPPDVFFAGRTAAALWGLPIFGKDERIEIASLEPDRRIRRPEVQFSRLVPAMVRVVEHDGVRLSDPATTWVMLGAKVSLEDMIVLGDAVIREERMPGTARIVNAPLASLDDLRAAALVRKRRGGPRAREALPQLSTQSASPGETVLRLRLREWGFGEPVLDYDVWDGAGRLMGCSEIVYPEYRVAMEYEGDHHRVSHAQWQRDIEKYHDYQQHGWLVIRVTATLLHREPEKLRRKVLDALASRGWRG